MGFNASFAILKKDIISRANVEEEPKCPATCAIKSQRFKMVSPKWYHRKSVLLPFYTISIFCSDRNIFLTISIITVFSCIACVNNFAHDD